MSVRRVRCVCGTVFDPSTLPACPECGAAHVRDAGMTTDPASDSMEPSVQDAGDDAGAATGGLAQRNRTLATLVVGVMGTMLLAIVLRSMLGGTDGSDAGPAAKDDVRQVAGGDASTPRSVPRASLASPTAEPRTGIAAFEGKWRLASSSMQAEPVIPGIPVLGTAMGQTIGTAFKGPGATAVMTIDEGGSYVLEVDVLGDGYYKASITPERYPGTVVAKGDITLTPNGLSNSERAEVFLMPAKSDMPHVHAKRGDLTMSMQKAGGSGFSNIFWRRPGDSGLSDTSIVGTWVNEQLWVDSYLAYRATFELRDGGDFRIRFTRSERGMLMVNNGSYEFKRSIATGAPIQGRYVFDGADRFTLTEPRGTAIWVRDRE